MLRAILGFPGYFADAQGCVWSTRYGKRTGPKQAPRKLVSWNHPSGYKTVRLWRDGSRITIKVGRAVCLAFQGAPKTGEVLRHLNDIRTDDRIDNLAWGSLQDNSDDAVRNGRIPHGEQHHKAKLTASVVRVIRRSSYSAAFLALAYGVNTTTINAVRRRESWKHID